MYDAKITEPITTREFLNNTSYKAQECSAHGTKSQTVIVEHKVLLHMVTLRENGRRRGGDLANKWVATLGLQRQGTRRMPRIL